MAKVDVIIASYNHVESIKKAVNSVLGQTFKDFRIIIVDDGSTDGSVEIIRKYAELNKKIEVHLKNHRGLINTYHIGFSQCNGKYIALCDCDDYWCDKDKLKKQVAYMEEHEDCGLCFTLVYDKRNKLIPMSVSADTINNRMSFDTLLKSRANINAQSYLIRKSAFDKCIDFQHFVDVGFHVWDYPIVLELIQHTKFYCMDFYSAVFVRNKESITNTRSRKRRFTYLWNNYKIKYYYMKKYKIKVSTLLYLIYRATRDIYSIVFKRWT